MKRRMLLSLPLVAAGLLASAGALAASDHTISVTAAVTGKCVFSTPGGTTTVALGNIDPAGTGNVSNSATVGYKCTKGYTASGIQVAGVAYTAPVTRTLTHTDTVQTMSYTFSVAGYDSVGAGFGAGITPSNVTVTATVADTVYQNAGAGSYSDSVLLTLDP